MNYPQSLDVLGAQYVDSTPSKLVRVSVGTLPGSGSSPTSIKVAGQFECLAQGTAGSWAEACLFTSPDSHYGVLSPGHPLYSPSNGGIYNGSGSPDNLNPFVEVVAEGPNFLHLANDSLPSWPGGEVSAPGLKLFQVIRTGICPGIPFEQLIRIDYTIANTSTTSIDLLHQVTDEHGNPCWVPYLPALYANADLFEEFWLLDFSGRWAKTSPNDTGGFDFLPSNYRACSAGWFTSHDGLGIALWSKTAASQLITPFNFSAQNFKSGGSLCVNMIDPTGTLAAGTSVERQQWIIVGNRETVAALVNWLGANA
jgi:hypothetical protein